MSISGKLMIHWIWSYIFRPNINWIWVFDDGLVNLKVMVTRRKHNETYTFFLKHFRAFADDFGLQSFPTAVRRQLKSESFAPWTPHIQEIDDLSNTKRSIQSQTRRNKPSV